MGVFKTEQTYPYAITDLSPVARNVMAHFRDRGFEVKGDSRISGAWDVSITKSNIFRVVCGLKTALNIELIPKDDSVFAKAGVGVFGQQAIPTAITMLVFWPMIIPQIWGMISQSHLDDEAMKVIAENLKTCAAGPQAESGAKAFCMHCGSQTPATAAFCPSCGKKLEN
jgi:hypothetical protein